MIIYTLDDEIMLGLVVSKGAFPVEIVCNIFDTCYEADHINIIMIECFYEFIEIFLYLIVGYKLYIKQHHDFWTIVFSLFIFICTMFFYRENTFFLSVNTHGWPK